MKLKDIFPNDILLHNGTQKFQSLSQESRKATLGGVVFILPSLSGKDLTPFAQEALERNATAVVTPTEVPCLDHKRHIRVAAERLPAIYAFAASRAFPRQPHHLSGVTGTNGKTSTVCFLQQLSETLGYKSASLGTIGVQGRALPSGIVSTSLTTPESVTLHRLLDEVAQEGFEHFAMECSSHGLHHQRLNAVRFSSVGFTNLSHDHLDFHGNMESYFQAKVRLFLFPSIKGRVVFMGTPWGEKLAKICSNQNLEILPVGRQGDAVWFQTHAETIEGMDVTCHFNPSAPKALDTKQSAFRLKLPLLGGFQLENLAVALGLGRVEGMACRDLVQGLKKIQPVAGRLEKVGYQTIVDFAHTPDALERTLKTLRHLTQKKLFLVFGCGGERDQKKRCMMGKIAGQYADTVIVTDDNPRNEDPQKIRQEILQGCVRSSVRFTEIANRRDAIEYGLSAKTPENVLLIAGKGHEKTQIYADYTAHFSDQECVKTFLNKRM